MKLTVAVSHSTIIVVKEVLQMVVVNKINGKDVGDIKESYTFRYLFESTLSDFYKLDNNTKKDLYDRFDKEFSELFKMPRAKGIFEENEFNYELDTIYMGDIEDIHSGLEFAFRYFFGKRQQYQKLCIANCDKGDFLEEDFEYIKESMMKSVITKKSIYRPYNKGLETYLLNYNKVDALMFSFKQIEEILEMIDIKRVSKNLGFIDEIKLVLSLNQMDRKSKKIFETIDRLTNDEKYQKKVQRRQSKHYQAFNEESDFVDKLSYKLILDREGVISDKRYVFLCFEKSVWENLSVNQKMMAIEACNDFLFESLNCKFHKKVTYNKLKETSLFSNSDCIYVGDLRRDDPYIILKRLVQAYSFNKNYENIFELDEDAKDKMFKEYQRCKKKYEESGDYVTVNDSHFIRCVNGTSVDLLEKIYRYINSNFKIRGQKIKMSTGREDFVSTDFMNKKRR